MSEDKMVEFEISMELYDQIEAFCKKNDMSMLQFVEEAVLRGLKDPEQYLGLKP